LHFADDVADALEKSLTLNATKDELKAAPGFKYDRETTAWVPDSKSSTR
jgi:hypothetical protein